MLLFKLGSNRRSKGDQAGNIDFHRAPGVRNLGYAADHGLGDHTPHRGQRDVGFLSVGRGLAYDRASQLGGRSFGPAAFNEF